MLGGVFCGNLETRRLPLNCLDIIHITINDSGIILNHSKLELEGLSRLYISGCASVISDKRMMCYGGYINTDAVVSKESRYPEISSTLTEIDLCNNKAKQYTYDSIFSTAGCSLSSAGNDVYIVLGGTSKCINVISDKVFHADPCDLEGSCTILKSAVTPIDWILCDKCEKWYHTFCLQIKSIPKGRFFCVNCKKTRK